MNQFNVKQGLKRFFQSGVSIIEKEVRQLVTMDTLEPYKPNEISREYQMATMAYLVLLKDKRDRTIKTRGCCDRRVQRNYMTKEETSSPTVM